MKSIKSNTKSNTKSKDFLETILKTDTHILPKKYLSIPKSFLEFN